VGGGDPRCVFADRPYPGDELRKRTDVRIEGLTVQKGMVAEGGGGGIYNEQGRLILYQVTVQNNYAYEGGGIWSEAETFMSEMIIGDNEAVTAGGGVRISRQFEVPYPAGDEGYYFFRLDHSLVISNVAGTDGGGVDWNGLGYGAVYISTNTVTRNRAERGGGVKGKQEGYFFGVTVAYNEATEGGGGVDVQGDIDLMRVLLADNVPTNCGNSGVGVKIYNLTTDGSCGFVSNRNQINVDPHLGALQQYEAGTPVYPLLDGSYALNRGGGAFSCPARDQRLVVAPQGGLCDIGSFERDTYFWVAAADHYTGTIGVELDASFEGVLANDAGYLPDGEEAMPVVATPPAVGTLLWEAEGTFRYMPPLDFSGDVTFTYQVMVEGVPMEGEVRLTFVEPVRTTSVGDVVVTGEGEGTT
ncbi:MAG TPA: Ig-like domain-containing protein, partial [Anaerolineae bacterium]|nr:Ig-like domain-containing protein [Anaerolineae bacterium]